MEEMTANDSSKAPAVTAPRIDHPANPWYLDATPLATLPWLIRLQWANVAIQAGVVLFAWLLPHADFPLRRITLIVLTALVSSLTAAIWLTRDRQLPPGAQAIALAVDMLLLAALLELTGGPFNPFAVILVVQVTFSALTLPQGYALATGVFAATCYAVLVYWHTRELALGHHRLNDFPTHLLAMWIAVTATAKLAGYFVVHASNALARREAELDQMRRRAARTERLVSLTTLAAGAAHELSTPLGTIALAAHELERAAMAHGQVPALLDDAQLIRSEVARCHAILDQMSGRAGGVSEDVVEPVDLQRLLNDIRDRLPAAQASRLRLTIPELNEPVLLPLAGFRQTIVSLIKNAIDASDGEILVEVAQTGDRLRLTVRDHGAGMPPHVLERAGDPFFTTKEPGRGLGLGLFLARVFAERCGGSLVLMSDQGLTASLELPRQVVGGTS